MIFVECKPDYALVCKLREDQNRKVEHSYGKSSVLNKLVREGGYENSLGMIDEDPNSNQPKTLREFMEISNVTDCKIKILNYTRLNNNVIVLCPRLEEWIIAASNEAGLRMIDYGLPNEPDKLHEIINLNVEKFNLLIDDLMGRSNRINKLKKSLNGDFS